MDKTCFVMEVFVISYFEDWRNAIFLLLRNKVFRKYLYVHIDIVFDLVKRFFLSSKQKFQLWEIFTYSLFEKWNISC